MSLHKKVTCALLPCKLVAPCISELLEVTLRCKVLIVVLKITVLWDVMYFRETYFLHSWSPLRCSEILVPVCQVQDLIVGTFLQNCKMSHVRRL